MQAEIVAEYGEEGATAAAGERAPTRRGPTCARSGYCRPEFQALWERVEHKTQICGEGRRREADCRCDPELDKATIRKPRVTIAKAECVLPKEDLFEAIVQSGGAHSH